METKCPTCFKTFSIKPYLFKEKGNYCANACRRTGKNVICDECGSVFYKKKVFLSSDNHYCSRDCSRKNTCFKKGISPWNKNLKGIHLSPGSEFKKGRISFSKCDVGTIKVRKRSKDKSPRAFIKIGLPNKWKELSKVVWENNNGTIPKGHVIHHKDRNTLNDDINNLECLSRADHLLEHFDEFNR